MATARKLYYVEEGRQDEYEEAAATATPHAQDETLLDDTLAAEVCPRCGELLAWHEARCEAAPPEPAAPEETPSAPAPAPGLTFAYGLGQRVQPALDNRTGAVVWRGQVKQRHSPSGLVRRVNVYRLDNGFWDCYYEEDLLVA
ncbi:hypothetical protein GCM10023185_31410 [Hymenobacter saemangeumensis]|uniref:DUF4178 domain-containing protein n=1 Tax=Hymenobacter saemangeumensis TaxID=1084522 RepID=A0ABP8IMQ3_9BACT